MLTARQPSDDGLVDLHLGQMVSRGLSPLTVQGRRLALARLARYLGAPPMGATSEQVGSFLEHRRRQKVSRNTIRNDLGHLRAYYGWLVRHDYRRDDPTGRLDTPRLYKPGVPAAEDDVIADALSRADVDDAAILALAAFGGLRASEIGALDWTEVDLRRSTISIRGKGEKRRTVSISQPLMDALNALPHRHGSVIRRRDGGEGSNAPWQISKRASLVLGGRSGGVTLHQLRHRFATAAYAGTRDLRAVQDALGHSSPATTALYAHVTAEKVRAAADAAATLRLLP